MKDDAYELLAQRYAELEQEKAELAELLDRAETERDALAVQVEAMRNDLNELANSSDGVAGLHLNGDVATWDELFPGGRNEEWLMSFGDEPTACLARRDAEVIGSLHFPTMLRRMWSGGDVQRWLDEQAEEKLRQAERGES
ncbi:hypothetical protein QC589_00435 [Halomonas elongata]|uniref:hypothetical protein n=1 Tax=Halomonas elongata TaxID=2746 RepID=UPI00334D0FB7